MRPEMDATAFASWIEREFGISCPVQSVVETEGVPDRYISDEKMIGWKWCDWNGVHVASRMDVVQYPGRAAGELAVKTTMFLAGLDGRLEGRFLMTGLVNGETECFPPFPG